MTTKTEYTCNLCREPIADNSQGNGINFLSSTSSRMQFKPLSDCHNHLCNKCLEAIGVILKQHP